MSSATVALLGICAGLAMLGSILWARGRVKTPAPEAERYQVGKAKLTYHINDGTTYEAHIVGSVFHCGLGVLETKAVTKVRASLKSVHEHGFLEAPGKFISYLRITHVDVEYSEHEVT